MLHLTQLLKSHSYITHKHVCCYWIMQSHSVHQDYDQNTYQGCYH